MSCWTQEFPWEFRTSIVLAVFDFAAVFPSKDDAFGIDDDEPAGDQAGVDELFFGDLALAPQGAEVGPPGQSPGRNVIITGHFDGADLIAVLFDANNLVKMSRLVADPLACQS